MADVVVNVAPMSHKGLDALHVTCSPRQEKNSHRPNSLDKQIIIPRFYVLKFVSDLFRDKGHFLYLEQGMISEYI